VQRLSVYVVEADASRLETLLITLRGLEAVALRGHARTLAAAAGDPGAVGADVLMLHAGAAMETGIAVYLPFRACVVLSSRGELAWPAIDHVLSVADLEGLAVIDEAAPAGRIGRAIEMAAAGGFVAEMSSIEPTLRNLASMAARSGPAPIERLSDRESEVLELVAAGLSNKEIAKRLTVSEGTIKSHVSHIMAKLRLGNRSQAVAYALAVGFARPK
jgi:DNA-binding NarL/FixJ family response regulator